MSVNIIAKATILIAAPPRAVWRALTTPELIKKYFFGAEATSSWKEGSELTYTSMWNGKQYVDRGTILKMVPGKLLQHSHFSESSGLEDLPENYSNVTYELGDEDGQTQLIVRQENIQTIEQKEKAEKNWQEVLNNLKGILENKSRERVALSK